MELIFLTPADLLALDYLNVPVASVLKPEPKRHCVYGGNPPCPICGERRRFWENQRGMWALRCGTDELEDIHAWLRGDHENSSKQFLGHSKEILGFGDVPNP